MRTTGLRFDMKLISRTALADYMRHRDISQAELARRAGISPQLVNHLVRGVRNSVRPSTAQALECALDAPKGFIFSEKVSRVTRDAPASNAA